MRMSQHLSRSVTRGQLDKSLLLGKCWSRDQHDHTNKRKVSELTRSIALNEREAGICRLNLIERSKLKNL